MYANAREYMTAAGEPRPLFLCRRHQDEPRHVAVELDRALAREGGCVVQVDRVAGRMDVDVVAVAADAHAHARAAPERHAADHAIGLEVERPELIVLDGLQHAVATPAIGRDREAQAARRADRMEVDLLLRELDAAD